MPTSADATARQRFKERLAFRHGRGSSRVSRWMSLALKHELPRLELHDPTQHRDAFYTGVQISTRATSSA
ncbi:MAG: hypothetical protein JOZ73_05225 [Solirubrobacterales bacterium]|nr:hypothetical protein [Solirubrobacterales bacterium]